MEADVAYECPYCGESNHVGIDPTAGSRLRFTEDCPVCCSPIAFAVRIEPGADPVLESAERDD